MLYGKGTYDIQARYRYFNRKLFGGKLPETRIDFSWVSYNDFYGMINLDCCDECFVPGKDQIHLMLTSRYAATTRRAMDDILVHEMIHIWGLIFLGRLLIDHGDEFMAKACEIMCQENLTIGEDGDDSKFRYVGREKVSPLVVYEHQDGEFLWIPIHYGAVERFYLMLLQRARKHGCRSCIMEVSNCQAAQRIPHKGWPRHDGYKFNPDVTRRMFTAAKIRVIGAMGLSDQEARTMIRP